MFDQRLRGCVEAGQRAVVIHAKDAGTHRLGWEPIDTTRALEGEIADENELAVTGVFQDRVTQPVLVRQLSPVVPGNILPAVGGHIGVAPVAGHAGARFGAAWPIDGKQPALRTTVPMTPSRLATRATRARLIVGRSQAWETTTKWHWPLCRRESSYTSHGLGLPHTIS